MAKRKRLTPPSALPDLPNSAAPAEPQARAPEPKALVNGWAGVRSRPAPIADIAGASATQAALEEVAEEMADARREGRLIRRIDLDAIDETHLVRDRIDVDAGEMSALVESLRSRGQQTPIEVVELAQGRYGLISGWRRLTALKRLRAETESGECAQVLCLLRAPQNASDAYLAMVEENEIRAGLSFYERARIAARAAEQGVYPTARHAVKGLFAHASAPKRSKIASFLTIYDALDDALRFPGALSERLGLALAKAIETEPAVISALEERLGKISKPAPKAEQDAIAAVLAHQGAADETPDSSPAAPNMAPPPAAPQGGAGGIVLKRGRGWVTLSGPDVTDALIADLEAWLAARESINS